MRARTLLIVSTAVALALPAIAQVAQPVPQTPAEQPQPAAQPASNTAATEPARRRPAPRRAPADTLEDGDVELTELGALELPPPPPPVEVPEHARRDPFMVGALDPAAVGLSASPWGAASGAFLSTVLRRTDAPLASRWAHMALRNALLSRARAPRNVNPVDWAAERAWLLLRMGEADAARMLVAGVDVDKFTPKMFQVALQTGLANADPPALCPLEDGIREHEPRVAPMVEAMCASLSGEPESAAAQIDSARRRGRIGGIDLVLAQKVVGAGSDTGRAVTVEWEPVESLSSWRFGLAAATGMVAPERLVRAASPQVRAWQARAPLLTAQQRLESARIATALGVFSSQALVDLYALLYDGTEPDELPSTDAWQLRLAFVARTQEDRIRAMRRLWDIGDGPLHLEASRAMVARAAARVIPDAELQQDAPNLIASMLAAGLDREAAQWATAIRRMDESFADRSWAMLVLASPETRGLDVSFGRVNSFISRDNSRGKERSALLVAALAGLGRLDLDAADRLNRRHDLRIGRNSRWTRLIDQSAALRQPGTVLALTGLGFQTPRFERVPSSHMFHAVAALRRTGQEFTARMIAAEALART
jgi:hypothetical protein